MKYRFILLTVFLIIECYTSLKIKQLYFDPNTALTRSKQDGVVIIETMDGIKSTICMDFESDSKNAEVICKMMGYDIHSQKVNAIAMISSKKTVFSNGTHFQNIKCFGNESDVTQCQGFKYYNQTTFTCKNHNKDLHVFCLGSHSFNNLTVIPSKSNCTSGGLKIASLTNGNHGLLSIRNGNDEFTVCGINRNFGTNEARLFCKELLCEKSANARIIEGYYLEGASVGGFKNMKCSPNATSLSDCTNVYPYDNERCTPSDNIGILCSSDPEVADPDPEVYCYESHLSLYWNKTIHHLIEMEHVSILDNGIQCSDVKVDKSVSLNVSYGSCGMIKEGNNETVTYSFQAQRLYPKIKNNIIIKNDQLYKVSCIIMRNDSSTETSFSISSEAILPIIGDSTHLPTTIVVSLNDRFQPVISNIKDVNLGTEIFVKINLQPSHSQVLPFLDKCVIESGILSVPLILNKCPVRSDVVISPLDNMTIMFSFKSFAIGNVVEPAFIKCFTAVCKKNSLGCIPTCQKLF